MEKEVKKHLNAFLMWLRRRGYVYFWCLEFQQRGAPHFHLFLGKRTGQAAGDIVRLRREIALSWYRIVASGDPRHLRAGVRSIASVARAGRWLMRQNTVRNSNKNRRRKSIKAAGGSGG